MRVLLLVTGGRGGSDFFQGLLDEHEEILQIPSVLRVNDEFLRIFNTDDNYEISERFINYNPVIFDSRKSKIERHNRLGKNKDEFYTVSKKKFKMFFNRLSNKKKQSRLNILTNLFKAYYLARGKKIDKMKILLLNTHTIELTKKFLKIEKIKNLSIIHTMRYPINALTSPINNWLKYKSGKFFFPKDLYFQFDLAFNGLSDLVEMNKKVYVVLLENLIQKRAKVMKDFCRINKIKFSKKLLNCTYLGKQWWGDEVSGRWLGKSVKLKNNSKKSNLFFDKDLIYFYTLSENIIKKYFNEKYKYLSAKRKNFCLSPTKAEILVWKNSFKHLKFKHILSIPYFYLIRVIFLNAFFIKNFKLPYSIGSNK